MLKQYDRIQWSKKPPDTVLRRTEEENQRSELPDSQLSSFECAYDEFETAYNRAVKRDANFTTDEILQKSL